MHNIPPARIIASQLSDRLLHLISEIITEHDAGNPKDNEKYGMVSDLIMQFDSITNAALEQESNSKNGVEFINRITNAVDFALASIDPLLDEFYNGNIVPFGCFKERVIALKGKIEEALQLNDIKKFLVLHHNIEEGSRDLEYIPYNECGWEEIELVMCNDLLENLDMFYDELTNKYNTLLGTEFMIH